MGWIRYPDSNSLQAVHKVAGKEVARRYFSFKKHGGARSAREKAQRWLRDIERLHPPAPRISEQPQANKKQAYPRGISHSMDHRRGYVQHRINAVWHDGEKRRTKTFYVGREEHVTDADFRAAEQAAIAFRQGYIECGISGRRFDPSRWDNWRELAGR